MEKKQREITDIGLTKLHINIDANFDEIIEWVQENCDPEAVFPENELIKWAEEHGFFKNEIGEEPATLKAEMELKYFG